MPQCSLFSQSKPSIFGFERRGSDPGQQWLMTLLDTQGDDWIYSRGTKRWDVAS